MRAVPSYFFDARGGRMRFLSVLGLKPKSIVVDGTPPASLGRFLQKLTLAEFQEAEALMKALSEENLERLIASFADLEEAADLASAWQSARPSSALAHTVLGACLITAGWKRRGSSYAEDVDEAQWAPFLEYLERAQSVLNAAVALDPSSSAALGWLILAKMGGTGEREEIERLFAEATGRVPMHWPSHWRYFMATTEKWGGSHREMFAFANAVSAKAGKGSILHSLLAAAYCEFALAEGHAALKQMRSLENAERVRVALYKWLAATPATLDEKLEQVSGGFSAMAINHFAAACYLCGAFPEARSLVNALHDEIETVPWCWIAKGVKEQANPGFVFDRVKRELATAAG
ncbi:DUF4034 domain-containing protein [Uliginosibacterium aquaticum]|uniref:DUF4034 domain-containing protein n=1 Tax=Uliginosibacterium aquaticum TaxID=2731212 RepID=A0ABX2IIK4_9RHOO|nr:DUF4034 domain-containing protein [Uliginosibacterium aquaticum]NSL54444.1 DUF4034 domain-containing protein [Uliginosibacterium aquaticum]